MRPAFASLFRRRADFSSFRTASALTSTASSSRRTFPRSRTFCGAGRRRPGSARRRSPTEGCSTGAFSLVCSPSCCARADHFDIEQHFRRRRAAERAQEVVRRRLSSTCSRRQLTYLTSCRIHCFENVTALLFLASLAGYDVRPCPHLPLVAASTDLPKPARLVLGGSLARSNFSSRTATRTRCRRPSCSSTRSATRSGSSRRRRSSSSTRSALVPSLPVSAAPKGSSHSPRTRSSTSFRSE